MRRIESGEQIFLFMWRICFFLLPRKAVSGFYENPFKKKKKKKAKKESN
jgi:hypothetical protein